MPHWLKLTLVTLMMSFLALVLSITMQIVVQERQSREVQMDMQTSYNYGGEFVQKAPTLNAIEYDSSFGNELKNERGLSSSDFLRLAKSYVENTNLLSTNGNVTVNIDLQKRGLRYEPTFVTRFDAEYVLYNSSDEESFVQFEFPFPDNVLNKEINNARLTVDGVIVEKPVRQNQIVPQQNPNCEIYGNCYENNSKSALYWEGKVPAKAEVVVLVSYQTVGLSTIVYEGIENPNGAQNFNFEVIVLGSRKYDNQGSLSIDSREYISEEGKNGIILKWEKPELFSKPEVRISVATMTNPAKHLNEMYKIMVPLYLFFAVVLIIMSELLKKKLSPLDLGLLSTLFLVFFPFLHYLVSFNIDPSADFLINTQKDINFSMPLYSAFGISFVLVGGLMLYLVRKTTDLRYTLGSVLPLLLISMGFFPLAMTLPEYKYLLVLLGIVFILAVAIQIRVKRLSHQNDKTLDRNEK